MLYINFRVSKINQVS